MKTSTEALRFVVVADGVAVEVPDPASAEPGAMDRFRREVADWLTAHRPALLTADCSRLTHINSLTLGILVEMRKRLDGVGGRLRIAGMSETLMPVFRLTRLETQFEFVASVRRRDPGRGSGPVGGAGDPRV